MKQGHIITTERNLGRKIQFSSPEMGTTQTEKMLFTSRF